LDKSNIVLIGFMGTGKTTIGKVVSEKLGYSFIDTDAEIEKECGIGISEIFNNMGEGYFRKIETEVIDKVSNYSKYVIACGGGAVKNEVNVTKLRFNGLIVCLKADADTIYRRVEAEKNRPLVYDRTKDDIAELMKEREQLYSVAEVCIDTSFDDPFIAANKIIEVFKALEGK